MRLDNIKELKRLSVSVGNVFRLECFPNDGVTPKEKGHTSRHKYIVIAGIDDEGNYIGATLINTEINNNFRRQIEPFQREIHPEQYDFLKGKSRYIDCYNILPISKERIVEEAKYIGVLSDVDISEVKKLLKSSPIIDINTIHRFNL